MCPVPRLSLEGPTVDLRRPDLSLVGIKTFLQTDVFCYSLCYTEITNIDGQNEKPGPKGQGL